MPDMNFRKRVEAIIAEVPRGQVTTYGDVAALAGSPNASRVVGGIAHYGDPSLPWHRMVNHAGGLARGFPGGPDVQQQLLEQENIRCTNYIVNNFKELRWIPKHLR